jgi:hypothetical protein
VAQRRALANRPQFLSPAMLVQFAFAEIAGAGPERQRAFQDQAARYQRE